jgi:hypothetical protein
MNPRWENARDRLPREARDRVNAAHLEAEKIKWEAEAQIETDSLDNFGISAKRLRNKANFKGAKLVMRAVRDEFQRVGFSDDELRKAMDYEIEGAVNSLELNGAQKHLLSLEFTRPSRDASRPMARSSATIIPTKPKRKTTRIPTTINSLEAAARVEAFISASHLTQTQFANQAGTTDRTLRSFRATGKIRGDIFSRIAMAMGLTPAELLATATGK